MWFESKANVTFLCEYWGELTYSHSHTFKHALSFTIAEKKNCEREWEGKKIFLKYEIIYKRTCYKIMWKV